MSRQLLIPVGFLLLGLISGLGIGLSMGGGAQSPEASETHTAGSLSGIFSSSDAQNRVEANTLLSNRILELEKELAEQKNEQHAALADRMAFFKKYHNSFILFGAFGFGGNFKICPALADLLGLSKEEQQVVEQHLQEANREILALEKSKAVLVKQSADSVTFEIPVAPEGADIKAKLDGNLSADIGDDRADLLKSYFQHSDFGGFAAQKRRIEITWKEQNGSPQYSSSDNYLGPNGTPTSGSSGSGLSTEQQMLLQTVTGP